MKSALICLTRGVRDDADLDDGDVDDDDADVDAADGSGDLVRSEVGLRLLSCGTRGGMYREARVQHRSVPESPSLALRVSTKCLLTPNI